MRLIDADALKGKESYIMMTTLDTCFGSAKIFLTETIDNAPTVDAVPVVHSRWVLGGYDDMHYVCERCGHKQSEYYAKPTANFCPNCGAKMEGEK